MASQKFPVSKDECIKLTSTHKGGGDENLDDWLDNHAASSTDKARIGIGATKDQIGVGTLKTKAMAVSIDGISSDKEIINVQAALMAFYEGPSAPNVNNPSGSNNSSVHPYFKQDVNGMIEQEVGDKISIGADLFTLSSSANRGSNGAITKITVNGNEITTSGDTAKVCETSVVCGSYGSGGSYTDDTAAGADNIGDNNGNNIATRFTIGSTDNISSSVKVKSKKEIFVVPSATQQGRVRIVINSLLGNVPVTFAQNTLTGTGKGIFHGWNGKNIEVDATAQQTNVPAKSVTMANVTSTTYYVGIGYRKWFMGTINTNDIQSIKTALADNGCRNGYDNSDIVAVSKANGKVSNGTKTQALSGVSEKYFWIAIPADKEITAVRHKDQGMFKQTDNFIKLSGTIDVYGANSQFDTPYKVYMIANSNNAIVKFNVSELVEFDIADANS